MIKGTTKSGFGFRIREGMDDDYELLKLIRKSNDDASYLVDIVEKLLGEEQAKELEEFCKVDGQVRLSKIEEVIEEIFEQAAELKNSETSPA